MSIQAEPSEGVQGSVGPLKNGTACSMISRETAGGTLSYVLEYCTQLSVIFFIHFYHSPQ